MILIVDDDPSVTASLALLLKQAGQPSHAVSSPAAAVAWLEREPCELVLQDMNFSRRTTGEEGLELLGQIKALHPDLPVILITAWGSIALAVDGMKAGASDFITKPWTNEQLLQSVRAVAGRVGRWARRLGPRCRAARTSTRATTSARWSGRTRACCGSSRSSGAWRRPTPRCW